jgi:hypothetical protein
MHTQTTQTQPLAPCPFCGRTDKDPVADYDNTPCVALHQCIPIPRFRVECDGCNCTGPVCSTPEEAVAYWNKAKPVITDEQWRTLSREWFGCKYAAMQPEAAIRARCSDMTDEIIKLENRLAETTKHQHG